MARRSGRAPGWVHPPGRPARGRSHHRAHHRGRVPGCDGQTFRETTTSTEGEAEVVARRREDTRLPPVLRDVPLPEPSTLGWRRRGVVLAVDVRAEGARPVYGSPAGEAIPG